MLGYASSVMALYLLWKRYGRRYAGVCQFHNDSAWKQCAWNLGVQGCIGGWREPGHASVHTYTVPCSCSNHAPQQPVPCHHSPHVVNHLTFSIYLVQCPP